MESTTELKERDFEVLAFVIDTYTQTGFAPSYGEIAEHLGIGKGSVVSDSVKRLEDAGKLVFSNGRKYFIPANWRQLIAEGELVRIRKQTSERVRKHREIKRRAKP